MSRKRKIVDVLAVVHLGNYEESGRIIDDSCPCCHWNPPQGSNSESTSGYEEPEWVLGAIWAPGVERGIGAYYQVFQCQNCGLVYATHVN